MAPPGRVRQAAGRLSPGLALIPVGVYTAHGIQEISVKLPRHIASVCLACLMATAHAADGTPVRVPTTVVGNMAASTFASGAFISIQRSDGVVLASRAIAESELGANGTFKTFTLNYQVQAADVGMALRTVFGVGQDARVNTYADFNNVVLTRTGTPDAVIRTYTSTGSTTLSGYADPGARVLLFADFGFRARP